MYVKENPNRKKKKEKKKETGHFAPDCYKNKAALKKKEQHTGNFVCNDPRNTEKLKIALKSTNPVSKDTEWWINFGASQHTTPDKNSIPNYCTFDSALKVKLADDSVLRSTEKGMYTYLFPVIQKRSISC